MGGLDEKVSETLLWELFLQAGPVGKDKRIANYDNRSYHIATGYL